MYPIFVFYRLSEYGANTERIRNTRNYSIEKINKQKNYYNKAFDTKANINSIDTDDINIGRYIFTAEPT